MDSGLSSLPSAKSVFLVFLALGCVLLAEAAVSFLASFALALAGEVFAVFTFFSFESGSEAVAVLLLCDCAWSSFASDVLFEFFADFTLDFDLLLGVAAFFLALVSWSADAVISGVSAGLVAAVAGFLDLLAVLVLSLDFTAAWLDFDLVVEDALFDAADLVFFVAFSLGGVAFCLMESVVGVSLGFADVVLLLSCNVSLLSFEPGFFVFELDFREVSLVLPTVLGVTLVVVLPAGWDNLFLPLSLA